MNQPENLSPAASRVYELLAASASGQSVGQLAEAFASQPTAEGSPKAIATADSLVVKGIIHKEENAGEVVYSLSQSPAGDSKEGSTEEAYTEGEGEPATNSANAEEQRLIDLLQNHDGKLPESQLFDLYDKGQQPSGSDASATGGSDIETALQELTEAGAVTKEGDNYRINQ